MISNIKQHIGRYARNLGGWSTDRNIVVIESDDWGSIRMPSKEVYEQCLKAGYRVDEIVYEQFDSLASEDDLELLFEVLSSYKDYKGNPAIMTANILTVNPDFEKIESSGFQKYFYELITETFKRYPKHANCLKLWKKGKGHKLFYPQSHGREHLNVSMFMEALRQGNEEALFGFKHQMPGSMPKGDTKGGNKYVSPLRYTGQQDKEEKRSFIVEGLELFEELMGYRSKTFIPPNYLWSSDFDKSTASKGVRFYQGRRKMKEPLFDGTVCLNSHRLGEENNFGQRYLIRNAFFEPTMLNTSENAVNRCMQDISAAFRLNKPAVICSHRLNYVGFIDEENRDQNLKKLDELLKQVKQKWPQVEFLNSEQLGKEMVNKNGRDI